MRAASIAALIAAVLPAGLASAQPAFDFRAHVQSRAPLAMNEVNACANQIPPGQSVPASIEIEASIVSRGMVVNS